MDVKAGSSFNRLLLHEAVEQQDPEKLCNYAGKGSNPINLMMLVFLPFI